MIMDARPMVLRAMPHLDITSHRAIAAAMEIRGTVALRPPGAAILRQPWDIVLLGWSAATRAFDRGFHRLQRPGVGIAGPHPCSRC